MRVRQKKGVDKGFCLTDTENIKAAAIKRDCRKERTVRISTSENGYTLWLSARDTYDWAHKPGASWPCSTISGRRLVVCVDSNGLCDLSVNGRYPSSDIDGHELDAIVADFTKGKPAERFWPNWLF